MPWWKRETLVSWADRPVGRASQESFRTVVCDACLGNTRYGCLLGESICRRSVLPGPAPPPRRAPPRHDSLVVYPDFRLDRYMLFRVFVHLKSRSDSVSTMFLRFWKKERSVVFWAIRPVSVPFAWSCCRHVVRLPLRPASVTYEILILQI